jgi:uncharacterized membrane protein YozB (DUF420 family)
LQTIFRRRDSVKIEISVIRSDEWIGVFWGWGGNFASDVTLVLQLILGLDLLVGAWAARTKRYRIHQLIQTYAVLLSLVLIMMVMVPTFVREVLPRLTTELNNPSVLWSLVHALTGTGAIFFSLYTLISAGTAWLPDAWHIQNYRLWMRVNLALWWAALILGILTYRARY